MHLADEEPKALALQRHGDVLEVALLKWVPSTFHFDTANALRLRLSVAAGGVSQESLEVLRGIIGGFNPFFCVCMSLLSGERLQQLLGGQLAESWGEAVTNSGEPCWLFRVAVPPTTMEMAEAAVRYALLG